MSILFKSGKYSGVFAHITSLPSGFGIGDLGQTGRDFVDLLVSMKQSVWQILPTGPVDDWGCPYVARSAFAGCMLLIDPKALVTMELISSSDLNNRPNFCNKEVNFSKVAKYKRELFYKAFERFDLEDFDYLDFLAKNDWCENWALFKAISEKNGSVEWTTQWPRELAAREERAIETFKKENQPLIDFHLFIQYIFDLQWQQLRAYANNRGISILGDVPIFLSLHSADVWQRPDEFLLDEEFNPTTVAGCPPDAFSASGQMWGMPHYNWQVMKQNSYQFWLDRIAHLLNNVDLLRIDHFRGLAAYWSIPSGAADASYGEWQPGPADDLFNAIGERFGAHAPIVVEDLGLITDDVHQLRDRFDLPGMRVMQLAFAKPGPCDLLTDDNRDLPHNFTYWSIGYAGTHDNNTILGWYRDELEGWQKEQLEVYVRADEGDIEWQTIKALYYSQAKLALVTMQDILGLGSEARMNTPGTEGGNWLWRFQFEQIKQNRIDTLVELVNETDRGGS